MTKEFYAQEANRLKNDQTLHEALARMRMKAMNQLIHADVKDSLEILQCQIMVKTCDNFQRELESMIISTSTQSRTSVV